MVSVNSIILKKCFASYEDQSLYNNYTKLANKYNKLKENKEKKLTPDNQEKLREDVKKWFFSQSLETRMKICTVENELYGKILYQMIKYTKMDKTMLFKPKPSFFGDDEDNSDQFTSNINNYNPKGEEGIYSSNKTNIKVTRTKGGKKIEAPKLGFSQSSLNDFKEDEIIINNFHNYFTFQSYRGKYNINCSSNCSNDNERQKMIDESIEYLLKNIFFFSVHHKYFPDCFTLSPEFLLEKDKFENCFKILGNHHYFCSLIKTKIMDNKIPKHYNYNMPDWFNNNNIDNNEFLHSVTQYAIAFFEQSIMIKYILNNNDKNSKTYSLLNEQALNRFFDERKTAINYMKKHYNNENKINILKDLEIENDYKNLIMNKDKMKYVNYFLNMSKKVNRDDKFKDNPYVIENILDNPYSNKSEEKYNKMKNIKNNRNYNNGELTIDEIIDKLTKILKSNDSSIYFIDYMLFENYICLWKIEYFLRTELFEKLLNLITEQNLKELISDSKKTKSGKTRHRKKNKKKSNNNSNEQPNSKEEEKNNKIQNEYDGIFKEEEEELYAPYYLKANTEQKKLYLKLKGINNYDTNEKEEIRQFISNEIILGIIIDNVFLTPLNSGLDFNIKIPNEDINMINKNKINQREEKNIENLEKTGKEEKVEKKEITNNYIEEENENKNIIKEESPIKFMNNKSNSSSKEISISTISKEINLESNDSLSIKSENLSSEFDKITITSTINNDNNNNMNDKSTKIEDNNKFHNNSHSNNKKKKKEQTFFLFDTVKKKKKKNTQNTNTNTLISNEFNVIVIKEPNRRLPFLDKLHNDIIKYETKVITLLNHGMRFKDYCIKEIKRIIEETFSFSKDYKVDVYGSYATGLMIEASDIDIKIKINSEDRADLDNFFEALYKKLENENKFDKINPIGTASVPVIKLLLSSEKFIKGNDDLENCYKQYKELSLFKHYIFDTNELTKIKIDVTFISVNNNKNNNTNNEINEKNAEINNININYNKFNIINNNDIAHDHDKSLGDEISSVAYVKEQIIKYPEIKFILRVLKRYFYYKKMNTSFLGGLSSYNLFLLLLSYAKFIRISPNLNAEIIENNDKTSNKINLGDFLFNFLYFFKCLNFQQCIIDINSPNIYEIYDIVIPEKAKEYNFGKSIVIIDPITGVNASKSSYKIEEIQNTFSEAFDFFQNEKIKYDKEGKTKVSKNANNNKDTLMGLPISNKNDCNHGGGNIIEKFLGK